MSDTIELPWVFGGVKLLILLDEILSAFFALQISRTLANYSQAIRFSFLIYVGMEIRNFFS